jgi:SAM-dependent methyltransferase
VKPCPLCGGRESHVLYEARGLPLFQNKVYSDVRAARGVETGDVVLAQCDSCDFVFNASFDPTRMTYDGAYQNEQGFSAFFRSHLDEVADLVMSAAGREARVLEIGCGKATFFKLLKSRGVARIKGFDPAYQGDDPDIVRAYFGAAGLAEQADIIVLRHVLEHVEHPLELLHHVTAVNGNRGRIFIEVPDFDWIVQHSAFWDIFYEHCNYFTRETLRSLFTRSEWHGLFGGQYQGVLAEVADLLDKPMPKATKRHSAFAHMRPQLARMLPEEGDVFVWGASSKGVTFCNLLDRSCARIRGLIDINPAKQGCYAPVTGHPIFAPGYLDHTADQAVTVVVTNPNYMLEIRQQTAHLAVEFITI